MKICFPLQYPLITPLWRNPTSCWSNRKWFYSPDLLALHSTFCANISNTVGLEYIVETFSIVFTWHKTQQTSETEKNKLIITSTRQEKKYESDTIVVRNWSIKFIITNLILLALLENKRIILVQLELLFLVEQIGQRVP